MLSIGVDYYPEHWNKEMWRKDADLMQKTGVKIVRMAEFAWCRLEPEENHFDFEWLDEAVNIFSEHGIDIILCTPTNCPPLWVYEKYPDSKQYSRSGIPNAHGIRGNRCYNSSSVRKLSERIIRRLAEKYADNSAVIAWQVDNELEAVECCCPACSEKFRLFLKEKYGSLEAINLTYGNIVWGGEYSSWEQVHPPYGDYYEGWYNPAFINDWRIFCRESANRFAWFQADIIRSIAPNAVITTNTWLCENTCDMHKMFSRLDVVSYDNYPATRLPDDKNALYSHAFHLDLMRGIKKKNFWIMEQLSGTPGCWMPMQPTPLPGMIGGYALQAFAHGADRVVHFRWRSALKGAEMFWHGLIDHSNVPSRRFEEFTELCGKINELKIPEDTVIKNDIAIIMSFEQEAALRTQRQSENFHYYDQLKLYHDGVTSLGCGCDIISEHDDFSDYKAVIAPALYLTFKSTAERLHSFAENGGTVILTNRCGVKDENNNCIMKPLPAEYTDMTGCYVREYDALGYDKATISMNGKSYTVSCWCDIMQNNTADVLAVYSDRFYKGSPCVLENKYGKGRVYYSGVIGERDFYRDFLAIVLKKAEIEFIAGLPRNVEITRRINNDSEYIFVFNNNNCDTDIDTDFYKGRLTPFEFYIEKVMNT